MSFFLSFFLFFFKGKGSGRVPDECGLVARFVETDCFLLLLLSFFCQRRYPRGKGMPALRICGQFHWDFGKVESFLKPKPPAGILKTGPIRQCALGFGDDLPLVEELVLTVLLQGSQDITGGSVTLWRESFEVTERRGRWLWGGREGDGGDRVEEGRNNFLGMELGRGFHHGHSAIAAKSGKEWEREWKRGEGGFLCQGEGGTFLYIFFKKKYLALCVKRKRIQ